MRKVKVLIADDSALMRREIKKIMESSGEIEVIGVAKDGREAVDKAKELEPDVVALDINMPVMDGLTALQYIMMESPRPVVMISSLTREGALTTYEALELGAVDFVAKPGGTISKNMDQIAAEIIFKIRAAASVNIGRAGRRKKAQPQARPRPTPARTPRVTTPASPANKIVVIGLSTGGPKSIMDVLPQLPADFGVPVIVIQHMPGSFTTSFAQRLNSNCAFPFKEAQRADIIEPNHGYLAPGDVHMTLAPRGAGKPGFMVRLSEQPAETLHKPSVDVTMESVLECYGGNIIAVLMTGMGNDGARAMAAIRKAGGRTIAESEETAVVFGMPAEAIRLGGAEFVLPVQAIASKIISLVTS
ncbi:protein-glutamate methylesterase/protein-glutamine glutaminase [Megalodesulfovibrio gigas]|uniref:Protein-glutamate methylesterase/protein-glutamine glutaminase n=1 Tax=Megalodesulfovibrio gigas (strain ATCC 19364 / DSM 1382 / NCIMB 9332 / VKM B-1759) TaxID=1121448 RepID=T2GFM9_MEGG1|nr:chemotaxis response regulator protein-glutamate methylesterase [Megalodesulfovibrio gigas]AGW14951.1 putative chemotaxis-specific methylesterase CheB [Megalodesulfovibrio gigas DSM 1382 = ATCC 19364]